jgi:hypothetical protein
MAARLIPSGLRAVNPVAELLAEEPLASVSEEVMAELVTAGALDVVAAEVAVVLDVVPVVAPEVFSAVAELLLVSVPPHALRLAATARAHVTNSERPKNTVFNIVQRPHILQFIQNGGCRSLQTKTAGYVRYLSITTASYVAVEATPLS